MIQKIEEKTDKIGITLDEDMHKDMVGIMKSSEVLSFMKSLPEDSFRQLFWAQQMEAATKKNPCSMKWHPLMILWCLTLRHRCILISSIYVIIV